MRFTLTIDLDQAPEDQGELYRALRRTTEAVGCSGQMIHPHPGMSGDIANDAGQRIGRWVVTDGDVDTADFS